MYTTECILILFTFFQDLEVKLQEFLQNQWSLLLFSGTNPEKKENNLY